jgi:hypothetical protein
VSVLSKLQDSLSSVFEGRKLSLMHTEAIGIFSHVTTVDSGA